MTFQTKLLVTVMAALGALGGCAEDAVKQGVQGESCMSSADCGRALVCLNRVCATSSSGLKRADMECMFIECTAKADCCGDGATACGVDCRDERCVQTCTSDVQCSGACVGGVCVECGTDDDCPTGDLCIDRECDPGCRQDADCPPLFACQSGACVDVGCKSSRECIALLGSVRSVCEAGNCVTPCSSDAECGGGESAPSICTGGECTPIGCETTTECRARSPSGSGSGRVECRPSAATAP